jgi:diguanylate cyclase (GGDEF)-like protein/PAS domain S-box-containing protein
VFFITLALGVGVTLYLYSNRINQERMHQLNSLKLLANDYQDQIQKWLELYLALNKGVAAFFSASERVSRTEFNDYIKTAEPFTQLQGLYSLGFLQQVASQQLRSFQAAMKDEFPDYEVKNIKADAPFYYPLIYNSSLTHPTGLARLRGIDYSQLPPYQTAISKALQAGASIVSAPYDLNEGYLADHALVTFTPVYKPDNAAGQKNRGHQAVKGFVYSTLLVDDFISGFSQQRFADPFSVRLYLGSATAEKMVYQDDEVADGKTRRLSLIRTGRMPFAGNQLVVQFYTREPHPVVNSIRAGAGVLAVGLVLSLVLSCACLQGYRRLSSIAGRAMLADQFSSFFKNHPFSVGSLDRQRRFLSVNPQMAAELGVEESKLIGQPVDRFLAENSSQALQHFTQAASGQTSSFQSRIRRADGNEYDFAIVLIPMQTHGMVGSVLCIAENITERKRLEEKLFHQANYDALTGLPNRAFFYAQLKQAMARCQRNAQRLALMYLDIDQFKQINDTHGHDIGDQVIRQFAQRIRSAVRESDLLARVGGDEFVLLIENFGQASDLTAVADKLLEQMRSPMVLDAVTLYVSTSVGIACARKGMNSDELVRESDHAMYQAKRSGRNQYQLALGCLEGEHTV